MCCDKPRFGDDEDNSCANCDCDLTHAHIYIIRRGEEEQTWCSECWCDNEEEMRAEGWLDDEDEEPYPTRQEMADWTRKPCWECWQSGDRTGVSCGNFAEDDRFYCEEHDHTED
jgi:hypothetical protein